MTTGRAARREWSERLLGRLFALLAAGVIAGCAQAGTGGGLPVPGDEDLSIPRAHDLSVVVPPADLSVVTPDDFAKVIPPDLTLLPDFTTVDLVPTCPPGFLLCGGACTDVLGSFSDCGACGRACAGGQECLNGQCRCTVASCKQGCCQGVQCLPGNADNACGAGGQACAACMTKCANGGCLGCVPGAVDTQPCGNCGTHSRTCDMNGMWSNFGACTGEGPCSAGARRNVACGNCGTQTDTCSNQCQWQLGACNNQGACKAGTTRMSPCGNCGTQTDTCSNQCQWQAGACANQGPCAPGATDGTGCDVCSQKTCTAQCTWGMCALKPGSQCEYQGGNNKRGCACNKACAGQPYQWCLNTCKWSLDCACCTNNGCPSCL